MPIKHSQRHHYKETIYMEKDIAENMERCLLFTILSTCWRATARLANSSVSECFMNHCASACSFVSPPFLSTEVSAAVAARNHCLSYLCSSSMFLTNISSMASTQTPTIKSLNKNSGMSSHSDQVIYTSGLSYIYSRLASYE